MSEQYYAATHPLTFGYERPFDKTKKRQFVAYFYWLGWSTMFQLGFSICLRQPNVELHMPLGFIRIGWNLNPWYAESPTNQPTQDETERT